MTLYPKLGAAFLHCTRGSTSTKTWKRFICHELYYLDLLLYPSSSPFGVLTGLSVMCRKHRVGLCPFSRGVVAFRFNQVVRGQFNWLQINMESCICWYYYSLLYCDPVYCWDMCWRWFPSKFHCTWVFLKFIVLTGTSKKELCLIRKSAPINISQSIESTCSVSLKVRCWIQISARLAILHVIRMSLTTLCMAVSLMM